MTEVLVFPDATQAAIVYLRAQLVARSNNAVVGDRRPKGARWVVVRRVGGGRRNVVLDDSHLVVRCGAATAQEATDLAQLCRGLIDAMPGNVANVVTVKDADFSDDEDAISDQPFSPFAVTIAMRGAAT